MFSASGKKYDHFSFNFSGDEVINKTRDSSSKKRKFSEGEDNNNLEEEDELLMEGKTKVSNESSSHSFLGESIKIKGNEKITGGRGLESQVVNRKKRSKVNVQSDRSDNNNQNIQQVGQLADNGLDINPIIETYSESFLDTDSENFLYSFIDPMNIDDFIDEVFGKRALVVHGRFQRLRYFKKDFRKFNLESLLSDAVQTVVWMKTKDGGKMQYLDVTNGNVEIAMSCYNAGHSLYFNPNMNIQRKYIKAVGDVLGLVSEEDENLENDEDQPSPSFLLHGYTEEEEEEREGINSSSSSGGSSIPGDVEIFAVDRKHLTPWHFDGQDNFTIQARGIKKWTVVSLQVKGLHSPMSNYHPSSSNTASRRRNSYLHQAYQGCQEKDLEPPTLNEEKKYGKSFIMRPGSILYLPAGMWHKVEAIDDDDDAEENRHDGGLSSQRNPHNQQKSSLTLSSFPIRNSSSSNSKYEGGGSLSINLSMHGTKWVDYLLRRIRKLLCQDPLLRTPIIFGDSFQRCMEKGHQNLKKILSLLQTEVQSGEDILSVAGQTAKQTGKETNDQGARQGLPPYSPFIPPIRQPGFIEFVEDGFPRVFDVTNAESMEWLGEITREYGSRGKEKKEVYGSLPSSSSLSSLLTTFESSNFIPAYLSKNPYVSLIDPAMDLYRSSLVSDSSATLEKTRKILYSIENDEPKFRVHILYPRELEIFVAQCFLGFEVRVKYRPGTVPCIEWEEEESEKDSGKEIEKKKEKVKKKESEDRNGNGYGNKNGKVVKQRLLAIFWLYGYIKLTKTK